MTEPFTVVFRDEYVAVLNKVAKVLVQPSPKREKVTLTSLIREKFRDTLYPCHRLDRETTGLIIYATSRESQKEVMRQFKERKVKKKYYAFVKGVLRTPRGVLSSRIIDREGRKFGEKPRDAKTLYTVRSIHRGFCVLELVPVTGRTNQLRIQLARIGHPILGEDKYAFRKDFPVKFKRVALHAFFLSFSHPVSKETLTFTIGMPGDMDHFLKK